MKFGAVLFDAAGTLLNLAEPVGETYARYARQFGFALDPRRLQTGFIESLRGMPPMVFPNETPRRIEEKERAWWRELVVRAVAGAKDARDEWQSFDDYFDLLFRHFATVDAWRVAPGASALLAELRRRGAKTAIVSNFDHRLHGLLEGLQLRPLLDVVVLPRDAGAAKPDARIFLLALQRIGVRPDAAVYVGDDPVEDLDGARRAGLAAIDVTSLDGLEEVLDLCL